TLVQEARLRADDLGEMCEERDHVVLDLALDRVDARNVEFRASAPLPYGLGCVLRDHAEPSHRVCGMRLDLEPDAVASLRVPDLRHLRACVARNHRGLVGLCN